MDYLENSNITTLKQRFTENCIDAIFPAFKKPNRKENGRPKMHHKMMLFSTLRFPPKFYLTELAGKTIDNVVIQSSANIWASQYKQSNQLVLYYGDSAFYDYNLRVWQSLSADLQKRKLPSFSINTPPDFDSGVVKAYSLPRKSNIILGVLNNIIKTSQSKPPVIHIAMGHFNNVRIAKKLALIAERHKDSVKIVARNGNDDVSKKVLNILEPTVEIYLPKLSSGGNKIHSKFMLIEADYPIEKVKRRQLAWAGSLNYTNAALSKNSETLIRMENGDVYNHLLSAWNQLRDPTTSQRQGLSSKSR